MSFGRITFRDLLDRDDFDLSDPHFMLKFFLPASHNACALLIR